MKVSYNIVIFLLSLLLVQSCKQKEAPDTKDDLSGQATEIKGSLIEGKGEKILLEEMGAREYIPIDTVECDASGFFSIEFNPDQLAFYVLRFGQTGYTTLLIEPGESIEFSGNISEPGAYSISGSTGSELLRDLANEHKRTLDELGEIGRLNREQLYSPGYAEKKLLFDEQFDSICSSFRSYSLRFIKDNPDSPAILIALYNLYGQGLPVFNPQTDLEVYRYVDSVLMLSHSKLEAVNLLHAQVNEAEQILNSDPAIGKIQKGEIAPDFVSSRPDGSELALSDLRGNYVLLGFWAGWSGPSREENATLREAAESYREKKFVIFQVSLDDDRDTWTGSIREDDLEWEHVSDLLRWDSPVAAIYQVEKIPYNMIIDPNGRVIDTDLYGEKLLNTLDNLLNH